MAVLGTLKTYFSDIIKILLTEFHPETKITGENVFQKADEKVMPYLDKLAIRLTLPGSGITGIENLKHLHEKAKSGSACLLLLEHYSNMDLVSFWYFLRKAGADDIANALIAIAGMKLNEENPAVAVFSSAFTRIVICPSRSAENIDPEKDKAEKLRVININRAAMKKLDEVKHKGKLILVFPSGTRYRPWDPQSKRGLREIDSYIKGFDYMCFVSVNGNVMPPHQGAIIDDPVQEDVITYTASTVLSCLEFRQEVRERAGTSGIEDKKQAVADAIMENLEKMHNAAEAIRQKILK
ncbi:glycerol-3-phosphate O-acyltransferase [Spirochaetia bacterium]|nr:glycerol-3-phosphate O-acyltransferase [Spirochaetia bacterium]